MGVRVGVWVCGCVGVWGWCGCGGCGWVGGWVGGGGCGWVGGGGGGGGGRGAGGLLGLALASVLPPPLLLAQAPAAVPAACRDVGLHPLCYPHLHCFSIRGATHFVEPPFCPPPLLPGFPDMVEVGHILQVSGSWLWGAESRAFLMKWPAAGSAGCGD